MDLAESFHEVVRIAHRAEEPRVAWLSLTSYLQETSKSDLVDLAAVDIQADVEQVRRQLVELIQREPPPPDINALYFGLFDTIDDDGSRDIGYYVAGVEGFDPDTADTLCDPLWWPDGRYLSSAALSCVKNAELASGTRGQREVERLLGYAGQLGAALLVSRFASVGVLPGLRRVVGFDSGDIAELTT
jgi:hypothetical protein